MGKRIGIIVVIFLSISLGLLGYARYIEPELLTVKTILRETEEPIEECRMVFFTDTHFGKYYGVTHAEKIVEKINELDADIVIFGGDLLDHYARDREDLDLEYLKSELSKIKASSGKYAVWGNHDYGGGAVRIYDEFMDSCGFEVLKNESLRPGDFGIELIGFDDYLMGDTDPFFYSQESGLFQVMISHEPVIAELIEGDGGGFLLSGHTHGGQVTVPFLTSRLLPPGSGQYLKGLYNRGESAEGPCMQMYVSSGIGMTRVPLRFLNVPEIIQIDFRSKE